MSVGCHEGAHDVHVVVFLVRLLLLLLFGFGLADVACESGTARALGGGRPGPLGGGAEVDVAEVEVVGFGFGRWVAKRGVGGRPASAAESVSTASSTSRCW